MPALRMHFTADDFARTRILTDPHPMWELVLSLAMVRARWVPPGYVPWRAWAIERLNRIRDRRSIDLLSALVPPKGDFPDFLTPQPPGAGLEETVDAVLRTPARRIRSELAVCGCDTHRELRRLANGELESVHALGDAAVWYHQTVLEPFWPQVDHAVHADRDLRVHDLATGGLDRLLENLPPCIRWTSPVLRADYPVDRDIELDGRGLTLIPSYFCWGAPVALIDTELPPVLVYPLGDPPTVAGGSSLCAVARLIGRTRAQVLHALDVPRTTTGLADHLRISPASASKHAAALRGSGLIRSVRRANTMVHTITTLGRALLNATPELVRET